MKPFNNTKLEELDKQLRNYGYYISYIRYMSDREFPFVRVESIASPDEVAAIIVQNETCEPYNLFSVYPVVDTLISWKNYTDFVSNSLLSLTALGMLNSFDWKSAAETNYACAV